MSAEVKRGLKPYYEDESVKLFCGDCREVSNEFVSVDVVITDPPYSDWVHAKVRRGGSVHAPDITTGGAKRPVISTASVLGFDSLSDELRAVMSRHFARLTARWTVVFSDIESAPLWKGDLEQAGLEYVRTGAWIKRGATPQFTGDRPGTGFEALTILSSFPATSKALEWRRKTRLVGMPRLEQQQDRTANTHHTETPPADARFGWRLLRRRRYGFRSVRWLGHNSRRSETTRTKGYRHRDR
jgi:hypothetical protein